MSVLCVRVCVLFIVPPRLCGRPLALTTRCTLSRSLSLSTRSPLLLSRRLSPGSSHYRRNAPRPGIIPLGTPPSTAPRHRRDSVDNRWALLPARLATRGVFGPTLPYHRECAPPKAQKGVPQCAFKRGDDGHEQNRNPRPPPARPFRPGGPFNPPRSNPSSQLILPSPNPFWEALLSFFIS